MDKREPHTSDKNAGEIPALRRDDYVKVGLFCLAVALTVVAVVAYFMPPKGESPPPVEILSDDAPPVAVATIALPATALEISNEELQTELVREMETLQTRFPQVPAALHAAAGAYAKLHQTAKASELWQKCIDLEPKHVGPRLGLATLLTDQGEDAKAVAILQAALAEGCSSAEIYYRLANAQTKLGNVEEAEATMKSGVQAFPGISINWLLLGQTQNQLQKFADAQQSLRRAIELGHKTSAAYFALANACQRQGKHEEAAEYRQRFTELKAEEARSVKDKPFQDIYQQALRPIATGSFALAGTVYAEQGDSAEGERLCLRVVALDPENVAVLEDLAILYRKQEATANVRVVYERLVELQPANAIYRVNLASVASQLEDWNAAKVALEKAKELRPEYALPCMSLAQLYIQLGDLETARRFAEDAVRREPNVRGYGILAMICQHLGDTEAANAAREAAQRITTIDPRLNLEAPR